MFLCGAGSRPSAGGIPESKNQRARAPTREGEGQKSPPSTTSRTTITSLPSGERETGVWWVRSDYCGLFAANLTVALLLFAQVVVVSVVLLPWLGLTWHTAAYTTLTALALISHTRAQVSAAARVCVCCVHPVLIH
jgi:hypothetical protein